MHTGVAAICGFDIHTRQTEGVARVVFDLLFVHAIHIEGRICHHEIESAQASMHIFVIGVGLFHVARQSVDGEVHAAEAHRLGNLLLPVDRDGGIGVLLVV